MKSILFFKVYGITEFILFIHGLSLGNNSGATSSYKKRLENRITELESDKD